MTIEELNEAVETGEIDELIRVCEARQVKALSALADAICAKKDARIILLCGGSSAGKTTTAKEDEDALAGKTSFPATDQFGNEYKIAINGQALDASEVNGSKLSKWVTEGLG